MAALSTDHSWYLDDPAQYQHPINFSSFLSISCYYIRWDAVRIKTSKTERQILWSEGKLSASH